VIVRKEVGGGHLVTAAPDICLLAQQCKAGHRHRHRLRKRENTGLTGIKKEKKGNKSMKNPS
jgi:hypothetical protein